MNDADSVSRLWRAVESMGPVGAVLVVLSFLVFLAWRLIVQPILNRTETHINAMRDVSREALASSQNNRDAAEMNRTAAEINRTSAETNQRTVGLMHQVMLDVIKGQKA